MKMLSIDQNYGDSYLLRNSFLYLDRVVVIVIASISARLAVSSL